MRHDIPSGWVELCDPAEVTERARRPISYLQAKLAQLPGVKDAAITASKAGVTDTSTLDALDDAATAAIMSELGDALPLMDELNDLLIVARLRDWSFDLPKSVDSLLDIPKDAYAALRDLCKSTDELTADTDVSPDPKADTPSSTA